jgi:hypothetical protein
MSTVSRRKGLSEALRLQCWKSLFGENNHGECPFCRGQIFYNYRTRHIDGSSEFECAHIISRKRGGKDTLDNLIPACKSCNKLQGTENVFVWAELQGYEIDLEDIKTKYANTTIVEIPDQPDRCIYKTKKSQCGNLKESKSEYCKIHNSDNSNRCIAITSSNRQCKNFKKENHLCNVHLKAKSVKTIKDV